MEGWLSPKPLGEQSAMRYGEMTHTHTTPSRRIGVLGTSHLTIQVIASPTRPGRTFRSDSTTSAFTVGPSLGLVPP